MDSKNVDIRVQIKLLRNEFSPRPTPGENLFLTVFFHAGSYSGVHETKLDGDLAKAKYKNRMFNSLLSRLNGKGEKTSHFCHFSK